MSKTDKNLEFIRWLTERVDDLRERYEKLCRDDDFDSLRNSTFWRWNEALRILTEFESEVMSEKNNKDDVCEWRNV